MKNLSEYALCFTTQNWLILHSKDINSGNIISEGDQKIINNCHIYMIHTRPLISFVKDNEEKALALNEIMFQNMGKKDWDFPEAMLNGVAVFKIEVTSLSCKEHL